MAPPERQPPLDRQLKLLDNGVRRAFCDDADIDAALVPDMQGIGSGPDVMSPPPRSASPPAREMHRPLADTAGAGHGSFVSLDSSAARLAVAARVAQQRLLD